MSHRCCPSVSCISPDDGDDGIGQHGMLPWYKTPSSVWLLILIPFATGATFATFAPRIEVYTQLVCAVHKPDIFEERFLFSTAPNRCAADPIVQAEVAKLTAVITTCAGVLACITTGWWGAFSDRHGRTWVLGITIAGLLLTDLNFILTSHFWQHLPGGYWSLVVGPLIEGSLGGMVAATAALNAYLADTTTPTTRSRTYSLGLGLVFAGMALGPSLGSLVIRATGRTLSIFYAAGAAHLLYGLCIWLVVPESRPAADRRLSRARYAAEQASGTVWKRALAFFSSLAVFWPAPAPVGDRLNSKVRRDWGLLLIATSYGLAISVTESYNVKFQYASAVFGWTSEMNGYWFSLVGAARALFLTLILPIVIKAFNPHPPSMPPSNPSEAQPLLPQAPTHPITFKFELRLAQASLLADLAAYVLMALAPTPRVFTLASLFSALGAGLSPAAKTVALAMFLGRGGGESGRLFGGLGVVQALGVEILGPAAYGFVYMKTAGAFPGAIFWVSGGVVGLAAGLLVFVRGDGDGNERDGMVIRE